MVEAFVDRTRCTGRSFAAANWPRLGESIGRGCLGAKEPLTTPKDIWVYPLSADARRQLQDEPPQPLTARPLLETLEAADWCAQVLESIDLGDARLNRRAVSILSSRWNDPSATFGGSFKKWADAKGAYQLIENESPQIGMQTLMAPHVESTLARMAAEPVVLLPQDTTTFELLGLEPDHGSRADRLRTGSRTLPSQLEVLTRAVPQKPHNQLRT